MDKLKLAWKLVGKAAKEKRSAGEIPTFLGTPGMLALMYDRIVAFNQDEENAANYLIDLAVNSLFAVASMLPDIEDTDFDDKEDVQSTSLHGLQQSGEESNTTHGEGRKDTEDERDSISEEESEHTPEEVAAEVEGTNDDGRWTKIPPEKE